MCGTLKKGGGVDLTRRGIRRRILNILDEFGAKALSFSSDSDRQIEDKVRLIDDRGMLIAITAKSP